MAPTSCATAPRPWCATRPMPTARPPRRRRARAVRIAARTIRMAKRSGVRTADRSSNEPVAAIYITAGSDDAIDDRHHALGHVGVQISARGCAARGGLSDHPGADLLSRRESRRDDLLGDGAAGGAVRADAEPEPDEFRELGRFFRHHAAIRPEYLARRRRAGGAG